MLEKCRQRQFDIVLVWKLDRAFRSLRDTVNTLHEFSELGIEFVSLKDNGLDMTTSMGKLMIHIVAAFAAFEADMIKARVRAGLDNAKARCKQRKQKGPKTPEHRSHGPLTIIITKGTSSIPKSVFNF